MAEINHTLGFNGDILELSANFYGSNVHITIKSTRLGMVEDSTSNAKDYSYMLDASPKELANYIMTQLAFYAYCLAEKTENLAA